MPDRLMVGRPVLVRLILVRVQVWQQVRASTNIINMFTREKHFPKRLKFDLKSFNYIVEKLKEAGFDEITIKIPKEYTKFKKFEYSAEEFIKLNYNFVSQILVAKNEESSIKILFINNSSSKANFHDTIFPSSNSEYSKYNIVTKDPIKIVGLIDFIDHILYESSVRSLFISKFQSFLLFFVFLSYFFGCFLFLDIFYEDSSGFFLNTLKDSPLFISFSFIFSIVYIFYYTVTPGGLYVNKFEHPLMSFTKRIFIGDFKDNLIVNFFLTIFKLTLMGIFIQIVWHFLGDIIIDAVNFIIIFLKL